MGGSGSPWRMATSTLPRRARASITDRPEVPVEHLRCAVNRPHDAGDRDEPFAGLPKLMGPAVTSCSSGRVGRPPRRSTLDTRERYCFRRNRSKSKALSTRADPVPAGVRTSNDPLEEENATHHGEDSHQVEEKLAQHQGHLPLWTGPFPASPERGAFARSSSRLHLQRRPAGFDSSVTSGRVIAG